MPLTLPMAEPRPLSAVSSAPSTNDLEGLPARALVAAVKVATANPNDASSDEVLTAFYQRYGPSLLRMLARRLRLLDSASVQDMVHDSFLAFWANCASFDPSRTATDEECDANVLAYLARRAQWKASSLPTCMPTEPLEEVDLPARESPSAPTSAHSERVSAWLETLSPREDDILRAYFFDDHPGRRGVRLPDDVVRRLCTRYSFTPSALRHAKGKLLRSLRDFLSGHDPL